MSSAKRLEPTFVSSRPLPLLRRTHPRTPAVCTRFKSTRHRPCVQWRCSVAEDGVQKGTENGKDGDVDSVESTGVSEPLGEAPAAEEEQANMQIEGQLDMNAVEGLDAGLEAALSKSWDKLELFGQKEVLGRKLKLDLPGFDDEEMVEKGAEEEKIETADGFGDSSQDKLQTVDASKDTTVAEPDGSEGIQFLEEVNVAASDEAVRGIQEANTVTKKKRATKKKATAKKATVKKTRRTKAVKGEKVQMSQAEMLNSEEWDPTPRWFFVQVKPGCEQSCAISIRNMTQSLELDIREVLVPTTKIMRLSKSGKSVKKEERMFPSYILVHMAMNRQTYAEILRVPNVQCFMGDPNRDKAKDQPFRPPLPVSDIEMRAVFEKVKEADSLKPEVKTAIRPGDMIEVISGNFIGKKGRVAAVKPDLNIVVAKLIMFAREASTELKIDQVKVVDEEELEEFDIPLEGDGSEGEEGNKETSKKRSGAAQVSAADDLAMLLSDMPDDKDTHDDELAQFLETDEERFPFMESNTQSNSAGGRKTKKETKQQTSQYNSAEDLAKLFADEDGDLSFFDELDDKADPRSKEKRADWDQSANFDKADDELSPLRGRSDNGNLREPSEKVTSSGIRSDQKGEDKDDDNLLSFLDNDDDFAEANILPDIPGEPVSKP